MEPDRFQEQFDQIQEGFGDEKLCAGPGGAPRYLYQKGHLITRTRADAEYVVRTVRNALDGHPRERFIGIVEANELSGVHVVRVGGQDEGDRWSDPPTADALDILRKDLRRRRVVATRNHIVSITVNCCPGDEPAHPGCGPNPAPAAPRKRRPPRGAATPVDIHVIDTGLTSDYQNHPWMSHVTGSFETSEVDTENILNQYVGHGTFIGGLVAAVDPEAAVTVHNTFSGPTAIPESRLGELLLATLDALPKWPAIISLSAGTNTGGALPLIGLEAFMDKLVKQKTLLVAAAGNNGSDEAFWPAAWANEAKYARSVVSVGALRATGDGGACFTNHGPWVKVYAPGERLVGAFTGTSASQREYDYQHSTFSACRYHQTYTCTCQDPAHVGERTTGVPNQPGNKNRVPFDGLASWSGTSFATPIVAALIADYMAAKNLTDPRDAADQLLALAQKDLVDVRGHLSATLKPATWTPMA